MRAQFRRATSIHLLVALLGSTAGWQARAQEAVAYLPSTTTSRHPSLSGFDPAIAMETVAMDDRIPLPDLPPTAVSVLPDEDFTGSIPAAAGQDAGQPGGGSPAVPPALSFDETGPAALTPQAGGVPPFRVPNTETNASGTSFLPTLGSGAAEMPATPVVAEPPGATVHGDRPAAVPPRPADAKAAVVPSEPPAPPVAAEAVPAMPAVIPASSTGLDAPAMAAAVQAFAAERVPTDTAAQAGDRLKTRAAIAAFYAAHADAPLWIADGHMTPGARAVLARLDHAAEDGLDLRRFVVPVPRSSDVATLARAELALSEAVVAYGRQASGSRVDVARFGGLIDLRPDVAEAGRILEMVPAATDPSTALQAFNPPQPGYVALREKLAQLRQSSTPEAQTRIPPGPVLKPGMSDARVPLIRARFGLDVASVDPGVPQLVYDTKVVAAVAEFQRGHGLPASGLLTPRTIAALSGGDPTTLEHDIIANMELWRWLPRELGSDYVEVNIPDYTAQVVRDGVVTHQTRVVVGQPDKPTPVFAQQMKFIIVNPYWNVPLSIIKNEMMPKLASDPDYFTNHGYEVIERDGVRYVRQPPGDGNALGRIKFMFPNNHSVYLHDTNSRSFFGRDKRALSHGCVRVEEPFSFAEAVMGRSNGWTEARIRKLIGGQERTINLPRPLPIFITYFTAFVDPQTGFHLRDDVYGYAKRVKVALGLQG